MAGKYSGKAPETTAGGDGLMDLLRKLEKDEILEVLSDGFCQHCESLLHTRIQNLLNNRNFNEMLVSNGKPESSSEFWSLDSSHLPSLERSSGSSTNTATVNSTGTPESVYSGRWNGSPASVTSKRPPVSQSGFDTLLNGGNGLSEDEERIRVSCVGRKKDFSYIERINGKATNVLQGLELHTQVFNDEEQKKIVECVYNLQRMGRMGQLRARTFTEPKKWMRGKGRVTIQFGCCYNYAVDKNGNPPGIIRDEEVDPLPPLFKQMIKRMVRWNVLPPTCVPNSCIVNIYDEGDCIPPHIDHHDFVRPFCTVSFLAECNILFGANLKILGPGEFAGPFSVPLPVGSVLILSGNGADVAKHCVPGVPAKRISITFRRMDETKIPYTYKPDPELLGVKPVTRNRLTTLPLQQQKPDENKKIDHNKPGISSETANNSFCVDKDEFPPLGSLSSSRRRGSYGNGSRP